MEWNGMEWIKILSPWQHTGHNGGTCTRTIGVITPCCDDDDDFGPL